MSNLSFNLLSYSTASLCPQTSYLHSFIIYCIQASYSERLFAGAACWCWCDAVRRWSRPFRLFLKSLCQRFNPTTDLCPPSTSHRCPLRDGKVNRFILFVELHSCSLKTRWHHPTCNCNFKAVNLWGLEASWCEKGSTSTNENRSQSSSSWRFSCQCKHLCVTLPERHSLLHFQFPSATTRRMPASQGRDSTLRWWSTRDPRPLTCPRWWLCTSSASVCCRTTSTVSGAAEATTIDTEFSLDGSKAPLDTIK